MTIFFIKNNIMTSIILFDLDGTLAYSTKTVSDEMHDVLLQLRQLGYTLGIVGGGEHKKCIKQLGRSARLFKYIFSECGSVIFKLDDDQRYNEISRRDIVSYLGSLLIKRIGNIFLNEVSNDEYIDTLNFGQYGVKLPTHVDIRSGLIYLTPVGMESDDLYRNLFIEYDNNNSWRTHMINILSDSTSDTNLVYTIGGAVGIACYPETWNKAQVVPYVKSEGFKKIYFFGDKTDIFGNDYPLYISPHVISYSVIDPDDTMRLLEDIFIYKN